MLTVPVYSTAGERIGEETIDPADFGGAINKQLLHDVVLMHLAARRVGTVNTRGRADVAGSGKKLFRQKGTGNARVGPKRTNKRKGGGVAFARRNRDYRYSMPKKAVRAAIRMALLSKFQDNQAIVLDGLNLAKPKTKEVAKHLPGHQAARLERGRGRRVGRRDQDHGPRRAPSIGAPSCSACPAHDQVLHSSVRNIEGVMVAPVAEFNTYDILKQRYLVLTREALAKLKDRVKQQAGGARRPQPAAAPATRRPTRRADPWLPCADPRSMSGPGPCSSPTRSSSGP